MEAYYALPAYGARPHARNLGRGVNVEQLVQHWGPWLGALLVGSLPFFKFWRDGATAKAREGAKRASEQANLIKIAQDVAGDLVKDLREEIKRANEDRDELRREGDQLRRDLEGVKTELAEFRRKHDAMMADKDAELALLRGENRQLLAILESYRRLLEANGIDPPPMTQPFFRIPAGDTPPKDL